MKYLVLHRFRSYGKLLVKGQVVDETEIRSPYLRQQEGKITPAVFSQTVPPEFEATPSSPPAVSEGSDDTGGPPEEPKQAVPEEPKPHKPLFSFRKN